MKEIYIITSFEFNTSSILTNRDLDIIPFETYLDAAEHIKNLKTGYYQIHKVFVKL